MAYVRIKDVPDPIVISPDAGGVYRAKNFRDDLQKATGKNIPLAMIVKQRVEANKISQMDLVGDVEGKDCIMVDDMIDTAGTLCKAATKLKEAGGEMQSLCDMFSYYPSFLFVCLFVCCTFDVHLCVCVCVCDCSQTCVCVCVARFIFGTGK